MRLLIALVLSLGLGTVALADIVIPGADGSDGDFVPAPNQSHVIDLSLAANGNWADPSPIAGQGVYDPNAWAVVYKYSSVNIQLNSNGYYVTFKNHPSGAPVVWLVSGNVTLTNGTVSVSGASSVGCAGFPEPGPGGFRGGRGTSNIFGSGGFGPGGGDLKQGDPRGWTGGSFGGVGGAYLSGQPAPAYSNIAILPLIGGSGGAAGDVDNCSGGGAGGGALLIAAQGTITINGRLWAYGGNGNSYGAGGSGGALKLIANRVVGTGEIAATGGNGWNSAGAPGRVAIQANENLFSGAGNPTFATFVPITGDLLIWPPAGAPQVRAVSVVVDGNTIPLTADPHGSLDAPLADANFDTNNPVTLNIEGHNVPLDWQVVVRVTPKSGTPYIVLADPLQGDVASSTTSVALNLNRGFGALQVRAYKP